MDQNYPIMQIDPWLKPYEADIGNRMERYGAMRARLLENDKTLSDFANGHHYFGFHRTKTGWVYREWAPAAEAVSLVGDFNGWDGESNKLKNKGDGVWECRVSGDKLSHGAPVKVRITSGGQTFDRIPLYAKYVTQDEETKAFTAVVWEPEKPFRWTDGEFAPKEGPLLIYECHVGMSGEEESIATYAHFTKNILPRVKSLGYTAIQMMAVMEHPYYGSFGYQVSNFFAASSRYGTPEDLKKLVNTAHKMGISVLLDIVHSHAAPNTAEGIAAFDGTDYQFFHQGPRGQHPAWGTKLFNYDKPQVIHFLLSNVKFWLEEYHFDGFRFDGVTSMLYHDHGLGTAFDDYKKYFDLNTDVEAVTYLQLAAELAHEVRPGAILIAEDMSGMPGMCLPIGDGGIGFDYRLGMGMPDYWVKTLKEKRDEDWDLAHLWHELNQRRPQEKVVGYCESHDQALVGDKTLIFWLADQEMYWHMDLHSQSAVILRAIALHKMIRLISCACSGEGYLNFMGNEFGHPEWVDFPREGNGWSYKYARRQWSLADNPELRYQHLLSFDKAMIAMVKRHPILGAAPNLLLLDNEAKVMAFEKGDYLLLFNFHPGNGFQGRLDAPFRRYKILLNTEWTAFGGWIDKAQDGTINCTAEGLEVAMGPRTALVLAPSGARRRPAGAGE